MTLEKPFVVASPDSVGRFDRREVLVGNQRGGKNWALLRCRKRGCVEQPPGLRRKVSLYPIPVNWFVAKNRMRGGEPGQKKSSGGAA